MTREQERAAALAYQAALDSLERTVTARVGSAGLRPAPDDRAGAGGFLTVATPEEIAHFRAQVRRDRVQIFGGG